MNFQLILNALPFPIYWIDSKKCSFRGGNQHFFSSLKICSAELIDKPISSVFFSDHLRIINELFNESTKNKGKQCSAIFHKVANDQEESILIQSISISSRKEHITIFSETYPSIKDFNQYLWE